jgi:hypothetical protein
LLGTFRPFKVVNGQMLTMKEILGQRIIGGEAWQAAIWLIKASLEFYGK